MSNITNDPSHTTPTTSKIVHGTNIHSQELPQNKDTMIQQNHEPTPFATTDASGYPDKRDGLTAHRTPQSIQDPHEHHKHVQLPHSETLIDKPLELAEKLQDPLLPPETIVPLNMR
ncbi:hypothetical protein CPB97_000490 [Podila verticillata]|nr:hypothetical protein CPB97_000490 [Podila verticillata]